MISAVIDRFEEDKAVLLADDGEGDCEIKINFPRRLLPKNLHEGDYLRLDIQYDEEATKKAWQEARDLLNALKQKNN